MSITTVPLPFAASLLAGIVAVRVILVTRKIGWPNGLISLFFALLGIQAILIGFRFGYELDFVVFVQPVLAMLVCPVAYMAFRSLRGPSDLPISKLNILHLLPAALTAIYLWFKIDIYFPVDGIIWASFLIFSLLFLLEIREGPDTFERFGTEDTYALVVARATTLCLLIAIMIFDVMIFLNFEYWGVDHSPGKLFFQGVFYLSRCRWQCSSCPPSFRYPLSYIDFGDLPRKIQIQHPMKISKLLRCLRNICKITSRIRIPISTLPGLLGNWGYQRGPYPMQSIE